MSTATEDVASITASRDRAKAASQNLFQRLLAVRAELGENGGATIAKGGTAPAVMGGFKFIEWDDVADKVGGLLNRHGVVFVPSVRDVAISEAGTTSNGKVIWRAVVWVDYLFFNADKPDEKQNVSWCGVGDDTSDKSVQKAITSGTKYALLKLFLLGGADDADHGDVTAAPGSVGSGDAPQAGGPPPARRTSGASGPVFRTNLVNDVDGQPKKCPECGAGELEAVLWESGKAQVACQNWRGGCKYKINAPVPVMVALRRQAEVAGAVPAAADGGGDLPF